MQSNIYAFLTEFYMFPVNPNHSLYCFKQFITGIRSNMRFQGFREKFRMPF